MPGPPLAPEVRDAIADAIRRTPTPTQRAIAREFGVSVSTVYRVAADYDLADAWEDRREQTEPPPPPAPPTSASGESSSRPACSTTSPSYAAASSARSFTCTWSRSTTSAKRSSRPSWTQARPTGAPPWARSAPPHSRP
ncbi:helix-turn-helix domain-containing protein [Amycolatopsis kentuckyensis]|uniref:helix-turn-helix domain-containing protein n=1 Tax=Amycolatopsis kentuckyensis TaxID=218823 RepID=UPI003567C29F